MSYTGYSGYDAESVKRQRSLADALMQRSLQQRGQPVQAVTQGLSRLADAWFAREAGERANAAEAEYTASQKKLGDAFLSTMFPEAQMAPQESGPSFDLTPGAFEGRREQTGLSQTVRSMADLSGDPIAAANAGLGIQKQRQEMEKAKQPTFFNRTEGVMAITPQGQASLVPGTETAVPVKAPTTALNDTMMWDEAQRKYVPIPGATEQYLKLHPGGAGADGNKPPAGYSWTPDGGLSAIKGGPADPTRNGAPMNPDMIKLEMTAADDWDKIYKDFSTVNQQYNRAKDLGALAKTDPGSRSAADLGLVVTITKMFDPTSVAREGEVKLTGDTAPALAQATNFLNQWINGKTILPDETRLALLKVADTLMPSYQTAYEQRAKDAYNRAKEYGFEPRRVLQGYDLNKFATPSPAPPANASASAPASPVPGLSPEEAARFLELQKKFEGR